MRETANSDRESRIWNGILERVRESLSDEGASLFIASRSVSEIFQTWWDGRRVSVFDETDESDAVEDFLRRIDSLMEDYRTNRDFSSSCTNRRHAEASRQGSIDSIAAYAEILPRVIRAREFVLGNREPLELLDAQRWLIERCASSRETMLLDLTFRFAAPYTWDAIKAIQDGMEAGDYANLLNALDAGSSKLELVQGLRRVDWRYGRRYVSVKRDGKLERLNLLRSTSPEMQALVVYADRLAGRCVGDLPSSTHEGCPEGFAEAVWLILAGLWPRYRLYRVLHSNRSSTTQYAAGAGLRRQAPYALLSILALDAKPEEISAAFQELRKNTYYGGRGGAKLTLETEVLCISALEVVQIDGVDARNRKAFIDAVLRRYEKNATIYGARVNCYRGSDGRRHARQALRRIARRYRKLYPELLPAHFPVNDGEDNSRPYDRDLFDERSAEDRRIG